MRKIAERRRANMPIEQTKAQNGEPELNPWTGQPLILPSNIKIIKAGRLKGEKRSQTLATVAPTDVPPTKMNSANARGTNTEFKQPMPIVDNVRDNRPILSQPKKQKRARTDGHILPGPQTPRIMHNRVDLPNERMENAEEAPQLDADDDIVVSGNRFNMKFDTIAKNLILFFRLCLYGKRSML